MFPFETPFDFARECFELELELGFRLEDDFLDDDDDDEEGDVLSVADAYLRWDVVDDVFAWCELGKGLRLNSR